MSRRSGYSRENEKCLEQLSELRKLPKNNRCADCGKKSPSWASTNLGVFMCIRCSGIHRKIGVHISFVKSSRLDKWTYQLLKKFKARGGNKEVNGVYEAKLRGGSSRKPDPHTAIGVVENFIRDKYERKIWVSRSKMRKHQERYERRLNGDGGDDDESSDDDDDRDDRRNRGSGRSGRRRRDSDTGSDSDDSSESSSTRRRRRNRRKRKREKEKRRKEAARRRRDSSGSESDSEPRKKPVTRKLTPQPSSSRPAQSEKRTEVNFLDGAMDGGGGGGGDDWTSFDDPGPSKSSGQDAFSFDSPVTTGPSVGQSAVSTTVMEDDSWGFGPGPSATQGSNGMMSGMSQAPAKPDPVKLKQSKDAILGAYKKTPAQNAFMTQMMPVQMGAPQVRPLQMMGTGSPVGMMSGMAMQMRGGGSPVGPMGTGHMGMGPLAAVGGGGAGGPIPVTGTGGPMTPQQAMAYQAQMRMQQAAAQQQRRAMLARQQQIAMQQRAAMIQQARQQGGPGMGGMYGGGGARMGGGGGGGIQPQPQPNIWGSPPTTTQTQPPMQMTAQVSAQSTSSLWGTGLGMGRQQVSAQTGSYGAAPPSRMVGGGGMQPATRGTVGVSGGAAPQSRGRPQEKELFADLF